MKTGRFIAAARLEFLAEVIYYNRAERGLGERFALAVEEGIARALAFPRSGPPSRAHTRRIIVKGFPFSIIYQSGKRTALPAEMRDLPGVLAYGATREEAIARAQALALRVVAERLEHVRPNLSPF